MGDLMENIRVQFSHSSHKRVLWKYIEPYANAASLISQILHGVCNVSVYRDKGIGESVIGYLSGWDFDGKECWIQFIPKDGEWYDEYKNQKSRWGKRLYATPDFIRRDGKIVGLRGFSIEIRYPVARVLPLIKESWGGD